MQILIILIKFFKITERFLENRFFWNATLALKSILSRVRKCGLEKNKNISIRS